MKTYNTLSSSLMTGELHYYVKPYSKIVDAVLSYDTLYVTFEEPEDPYLYTKKFTILLEPLRQGTQPCGDFEMLKHLKQTRISMEVTSSGSYSSRATIEMNPTLIETTYTLLYKTELTTEEQRDERLDDILEKANDVKKLADYKSNCSWPSSYGTVDALIEQISAKRVAEVGVAYGYHAEHLLDKFADIEYQGFDPYKSGYDPNDSFSNDVDTLFGNGEASPMDRLHSAVKTKLEKYQGRARLNRIPGDTANTVVENEFFDIAYIDGDHTYEGVLRDLNAWYPLVRKGGILCGDDYDWYGVKRAVIEFFRERNIEVHSPSDQRWYVSIPY